MALTTKRARVQFASVLSFCWALTPLTANAETAAAAVAANFAPAFKHLQPVFEQSTGHRIVASFASTGTLFAQIRNGAPFDVFLAADDVRPSQLVDAKLAVSERHFVYAQGQLVLWSSDAHLPVAEGRILSDRNWVAAGVEHIAIANPKTAPYGTAAMQTLTTLGVLNDVKQHLVIGQNIAQTFQFVVSGNAQLGFVAAAQVLALPASKRGSMWPVPTHLHTPIKQSAVLLTRGRDNPAAVEFLNFLQSPAVIQIIKKLGYLSNTTPEAQRSVQ